MFSSDKLVSSSSAVILSRDRVDAKAKVDELFFRWLTTVADRGVLQMLLKSDAIRKQMPPGINLDVLRIDVKEVNSIVHSTGTVSPPPRSPPSGTRQRDDDETVKPTTSEGANPILSPTSAHGGEVKKSVQRPRSPIRAPKLDASAAPDENSSKGNNLNRELAVQKPVTVSSESKSKDDGIAEVEVEIKTPIADPVPSAPAIPRFFFPGANGGSKQRLAELKSQSLAEKAKEIASAFEAHGEGMTSENFVGITKDLCNFPSFFSTPLHQRVRLLWKLRSGVDARTAAESMAASDAADADAVVTEEMFTWFWEKEMAPFDRIERFFRLIRGDSTSSYIEPADFNPYLQELLKYHPGLEFLHTTPEFQEKYAKTVIARIFYSTDRMFSWRLSLRDLRRSSPSVVDAFDLADEEEDINLIFDFFSYEHFYVLYCKFWELDTDRDGFIDADDLLRYGGHALTRMTVERVIQGHGRPLRVPGTKMCYEDFVYFVLSEEDKANKDSLAYWFRIVDLDGDGHISRWEMQAFYAEQQHRMECLGHAEPVPFDDLFGQLTDILAAQPTVESFTLSDFTRRRAELPMVGVFFDALCNLGKFMAFEHRDPFRMRQIKQQQEAGLTPFAQFAALEYARLAMEEEEMESSQTGASPDPW